MASVRARRGRGSSHYDDDPPRRRSRRAPPPPAPPANMPRLAAIKLNGGLQMQDAQVSGKSLMLALAGVVFFTGAAIAGAAWMGSSLFDVREAFARAADGAAADIGFPIETIDVAGVSGERADEVRAMIVPEGRQSLLSLDPADVKARVESLDWVESARVHRMWPSTLRVQVARRQAFARWQEDGEISVIDANGERLLAERAADHINLPLVVGAGAGPAAHDLLLALEDLPQTRNRISALVRVGDRRWNAELKSGATVALPEEDAPRALAQLEALQAQHRMLDRPVATIDMRTPGRMAVRVRPQLAGGPLMLAGGA
ncbi:MAG: cell division protein FtsQ/DivIB [Hyphomonadaceae bacterium]|nr:cell division protein FtsQ/DivIB [Hyphomonadaceae bacterium]